MTSASNFVTLANIPNQQRPNKFVIVFNDQTNELYAIQQGNDGLLQYSFTNDSWIKHAIKPPLNLERYNDYRDPSAPTAAINGNYLYLLDISLYLLELKELSVKCITRPPLLGCAPKGVIINNEFHLIGFNDHYKYDQELNEFLFLHEFETNQEEIEWIESHGLAKVKDEQVLIFGGRSDPEFPTFEFDFDYSDTVRQYDIANDTWTKLNIKVPDAMQGFGCTSILNGKYVLVIGGEQVEDGSFCSCGDIRVYCVSDQTFKISNVQCPESGPYQAITVSDRKRDELISIGFVRHNWRKCGIDDHLFPAEYLVRIIYRYYFNEFVHLFHSWLEGKGAHHKISVFDIIDSI
eukprot:161543_1